MPATLTRPDARRLAALTRSPDPLDWAVAGDMLEESSDQAGADRLHRRAEWYAALRADLDACVRGRTGTLLTSACGPYLVSFRRTPVSVRVDLYHRADAGGLVVTLADGRGYPWRTYWKLTRKGGAAPADAVRARLAENLRTVLDRLEREDAAA